MDDLEEICRTFKDDVLADGGEAVRSIVLHGSAAGAEFRPGVSDYNFAVLADPIAIALLDRLAARTGKWRKKRISAPLLLTPRTVEQSLDSYPLEFLAMKSRYRVLHGEDFLRDLAFGRPDVRLQCERELKSKLLLFRRAYLESEGKPKRLQQLLGRGLPSLMAIFRGMLYLKDGPWTSHGRELLDACEQHLELPPSLLHRLHEMRRERTAVSREEIRAHFAGMLELLESLALEVDHW